MELMLIKIKGRNYNFQEIDWRHINLQSLPQKTIIGKLIIAEDIIKDINSLWVLPTRYGKQTTVEIRQINS